LHPQATGAVLARRILDLAGDADRRRRMAAAGRSLARPDAAKAIVDRAVELLETSVVGFCGFRG